MDSQGEKLAHLQQDQSSGFALNQGLSVLTPETGTIYSNPVSDEECRAGPFLNLIVLALARGPSSRLCQLGSHVLLSPPTQSGVFHLHPLGDGSELWVLALELPEAPMLVPSNQWSLTLQSLLGLLPDSTVPYASQLPSISPGKHLQFGSAVGLSRLFQSLSVSSWLTLRSKSLRRNCHFRRTSWRWASWTGGGGSGCFSEPFISATGIQAYSLGAWTMPVHG